jgi:hypothetical protein
MSDRSDIIDLVSQLGRHLDDRDFEGLRNLFVADATVSTPGGTVSGLDALVAQARARHADPQGIQHLITNTLADIEGDHATVRANLLVTFADGVRDPAPFQLGEVYHFEMVRTPAGWQIRTLSTTPVWSLNPPALIGV